MTEATSTDGPNETNSRLGNLLTIFAVALRLGLTSFGGTDRSHRFFQARICREPPLALRTPLLRSRRSLSLPTRANQ